jgi:hypothetical protein
MGCRWEGETTFSKILLAWIMVATEEEPVEATLISIKILTVAEEEEDSTWVEAITTAK